MVVEEAQRVQVALLQRVSQQTQGLTARPQLGKTSNAPPVGIIVIASTIGSLAMVAQIADWKVLDHPCQLADLRHVA